MAVLLILSGLILSVIDQSSKLWRRTAARSGQFRAAKAAFSTLTQTLRQATLSSYLDYDVPSKPTLYLRKSDLHFISGKADDLLASTHPTHAVFFQAPLGFNVDAASPVPSDTLSAVGYYIEFGGDDALCPDFITNPNVRYRYRLMEFRQPAVNFSVFTEPGNQWFSATALSAHSRPIADNIVALVIKPRISSVDAGAGSAALAEDFNYNSRVAGSNPQPPQQHQLPALLEVTMVALSEDSAARLAREYGQTPPPLISVNWFQRADQLESDLAQLREAFAEEKLDCRVFTATIPLREAK